MRLSTILPFPILLLVGALAAGAPGVAAAEDTAAYGPELQGFEYPWPVSYFAFTSQGEAMHMAYMDVKPAARRTARPPFCSTARISARQPGKTPSLLCARRAFG